MGFFVFVIIVAAMIGCCRVATGKKPEIYVRGDSQELILTEHDALRIQCYANGARLWFSFPESTILVTRSKHEVRMSENGEYTFIRRHARLTDAGWYACAEEGVEIDDDFRDVNHTDEDVSWIYVYVEPSEDIWSEPEFVDDEKFERSLIAVAGSMVVIPCRVTSPTTRVELLRENNKLVELEENAVRYDPKIGFIMNKVDFGESPVVLRCMSLHQMKEYTLRYVDSIPTMFTAYDEDVTLQEGDELRIECSNQTKLSFLFPRLAYNSSAYEIVHNENGTSTFLRRSVISDDTGWYGCVALDIGDDYIQDYSINDTKKAIAWIYVYVNSSVPIVSGLIDHAYTSKFALTVIIPCKPTSPGLHNIYLNRLNDNSWASQSHVPFDPKVGFAVFRSAGDHVYQCATDEPFRFVSRNFSIPDLSAAEKYSQPVIRDTRAPSTTQKLVIEMTGNDLRLHCARLVLATEPSDLDLIIPSSVPKKRAEYIRTSHYIRVREGSSAYLNRVVVTMKILKVTESDSGKYTCSVDHLISNEGTYSRDVEIFDKNGGRYIKLGKESGSIRIAGLKGETVKWLVDLTDFPTAAITWVDSQGDVVVESGEYDDGIRRVRTARTRGAPQWLFEIRGLTAGDRGVHRLYTDVENTTAVVYVTVNVREPPTISLKVLGPEQICSGRFGSESKVANGECEAVGSLELNVTVSFLVCPKFPTRKNHYRLNLDENSTICHRYKDPTSSGRKIIKKFLMSSAMNHSGFVICQACNEFGCNEAEEKYLHSGVSSVVHGANTYGEDILGEQFYVSKMPHFTSTNLNDSDVILDLETHKNKSLTLECYVGGTPYPSITWFRDNVPIEEDNKYASAYDNSELKIRYFVGDEGGRYKCRAENINGHIEKYINVKIREPADALSSSLIAVIVLLLVVIVGCSVVIYRLLVKASRERKFNSAFRKGAPDRFDPELPVVDQAHLLPYHLKWEFPRELLKLDKILGSGAFGIVKKAEAKSIRRGEAVTTVAVKLVRSSASLNFIMALQRELKILAYLGKHPNVVNLLGACTRNVIYGELYVIVEYCRFGNLHDYLLAGRADFVDQTHVGTETLEVSSFGPDFVDTDESGLNLTDDGVNGFPATVDCGQSENNTGSESGDDCTENGDRGDAPGWASKYRLDYVDLDSVPISTRDLVYWSWQVSRAMDFLGKRKIVHGDLAARNILLSDNGIVKVCDFGLAKALIEEAKFRDQGANPLPYRWMAIESIKDRIFSFQSDVWSFGVVMWELFTLAETPYSGIRHRHLLQKLTDGYRLKHPKYATTSIYDMMRQCWEAEPADRPSFVELGHNLGDLLEDGFKAEYLEMHAQYTEVNAEIAEKERQDYSAFSLEPPSAPRMGEQFEMEMPTRGRSDDPIQTQNQSESTFCHCFRV